MATISDIVTILQDDFLKRSDITTALTNRCAEAYLTMCNKVPFEELQVGPETKACTIDDVNVDLSTLASPLAGICSIKIEYATGQAIRLRRDHTRNYDNMPTPTSRRPIKYARWAKKIELWPPPDAAYNLKIRYWKQGVLNGTKSATVLVIPDAWQELLVYETLYRAYIMLSRTEDAQMLMLPSMTPRMPTSKRVVSNDMGIIPRLWNELLLTIQDREGIDEDFSINPRR